MPDTAMRTRETTSAARVAAVGALALLGLATCAAGAGPRAVTSHIVIGMTENAAFTVQIDGQGIPGSPVSSSELGIVSFSVDDSGLPSGPHTVVIGDPGDLVISNVEVDGITESSAVVRWLTNLPSNSTVYYGPTASYGLQSPTDPALVTSHAVALAGLDPGATYHFRVSSDDGQGHAASSPDDTFQTALAPLEITNARVDSVGETWAALSWDTNRPASSWVEYGLSTEYGSSTPVDPALVTSHSVTVTGLMAGAIYHVRACSDDGIGEPAASGDLGFETEPPALVLEDVAVTSVGLTTATVVWTTNRLSSTRVEYGTTESYGSTTEVEPKPLFDHEVELSGLEPGTLYHFRAWSAEVGDDPVSSDDGTFTTDLPPLGLSGVTVDQVGQTWAVVSWLTDRPATSAVAYGETEALGDTTSPGYGFVTEHSTTLSGLAEGSLYHFRVISTDADDVTAFADSTLTTLDGEPTGPPQLGDVTSDPMSATAVAVTWTTDRPATSQVRYGTGGTLDSATVVDTAEVTQHSVLLWPVVPRTEYTFVVVSACGSDTSVCEPLTFRSIPPPGAAPEPRPIEIIKIVTTTEETSAILDWICDRPCSTWVEYGDDAGYGEAAPGFPLGDAGYTVTLPGLTPGSTYHFRICAWDVLGGDTVGEDETFVTSLSPDELAPMSPSGLACEVTRDGVWSDWDENSEVDLLGYYVYRVRARDSVIDWSRAEVLNLAPLSEPHFLDVDVEEGATYAYAVSAVDDSWNESELSASVDVRVEGVDPSTLRLSVWPNPVSDEAQFVLSLPPDAGGARLRIVSTSGKVVLDERVNQRSAGERVLTWDGKDPSGWPAGSGVYLCELTHGDAVARTKLTLLR